MAKLYKEFDSWFHEVEGYNLRSERCYDEYEFSQNLEPFKNLQRWLKAAFLAGRMETKYTLQIEEGPEGDFFITFPPELLEQQGWNDDTTLQWTDNEDGSWTIKDKT